MPCLACCEGSCASLSRVLTKPHLVFVCGPLAAGTSFLCLLAPGVGHALFAFHGFEPQHLVPLISHYHYHNRYHHHHQYQY